MKVLKVIVDEMPKSCNYCKLIISIGQYGVCSATREGINEWEQRPAWCPLEVETGWIPVEEILPKDEKEVLVRTSDGNMWIDLYGIWGDENTASWGDDNVTHWMPLPEPPEEEER